LTAVLPDKLEFSLLRDLFRACCRLASALRARSAASCCAFTLLESGRRIVGFRLTLIFGLGFVILTGLGFGGVGFGLGFVILTGLGFGGVGFGLGFVILTGLGFGGAGLGFVCGGAGGVTDTFGVKI
jgi:hypothetical protein